MTPIETLKFTAGWVRHWQEDVAGNLKPTPSSLAEVLQQITATITASTEVVATTDVDRDGNNIEALIEKHSDAFIVDAALKAAQS